MWWASVPWEVDTNKSALYFDSHQVALILDCQKVHPVFRAGFNESFSQQSPGALCNVDRKGKKLVQTADWWRKHRYFRPTHAQIRLVALVFTCRQNKCDQYDKRCLGTVDTTWTTNAVQTLPQTQFHVSISASISFRYLVSCLKSSFLTNNRGLCWCLWGHMRDLMAETMSLSASSCVSLTPW